MTDHSGSIAQQLGWHVRGFLASLARGEPDQARSHLTELEPVLSGRLTGPILERLCDPDVSILQVDDNLFTVGLETAHSALRSANAFLDRKFAGAGLAAPLVLVEVAPGTSRHINEVSSFSIVQIAQADMTDLETLVHELTHARIRSGHRMLDEGIAEWFGAEAAFGHEGAVAELHARSKGGPEASILAARRWESQPAFEGLGAPAKSAHAVAALSVREYAEARGLGALIELFQDVRTKNIEDIRGLLLESETSSSRALRAEEADQMMLLRRRFQTGDATDAENLLSRYRRLHLENPDDGAFEDAYMIALLLAADAPDASEFRAEFDSALQRYVAAREDTPLAYALCVSREGLNTRYATNFMAMNESFERGRKIIEAALDEFENDVDVLVTAAKFEFYTPSEYGGNPARARNYIRRAAELTDDEELRAGLTGVIEHAA